MKIIDNLEFKQVKIVFQLVDIVDAFVEKNNKTVSETILHKRYAKFTEVIHQKYSKYLDTSLGMFLKELKYSGDTFYLKFLNAYGDLEYCNFKIETKLLYEKGIYLYEVDGEIKYIGRCRDNFKKRFNQGYGKIHSKNCFLDGQSTNCKINNLVNQNKDQVKIYLCPMKNTDFIIEKEIELIKNINPEWNDK